MKSSPSPRLAVRRLTVLMASLMALAFLIYAGTTVSSNSGASEKKVEGKEKVAALSSGIIANANFLLQPPVATTLSAGDIAIIGYNTDGTDNFAFVALRSIGSGTVIRFTDQSWNGSVFSASGTDSTVTFTAASDIAAGTVIASTSGQFSGSLNLDSAGDTIYAYQGAVNSPTSFLYAIEFADGNTTFNGSLANTGLTVGTSAVAIAQDNGAYAGPTNLTQADLLSAISSSNHWVGADNGGQTAILQTAFSGPFEVANPEQIWIAGAGDGSPLIHIDVTTGGAAANEATIYENTNGSSVTSPSFVHPAGVALDTVHGLYFVADSNGTTDRILQGSLSAAANTPGSATTVTQLWTEPAGFDPNNTLGLTNVRVDTAHSLVYFTDGAKLFRVAYNTPNQTATLIADLGTNNDPKSGNNGNLNFADDFAIDFTHGVAYILSAQSFSAFAQTTLSGNTIWKVNGLSGSGTVTELSFADSNPADASTGAQANPHDFNFNNGELFGIDIDPATGFLYVSTTPVNAVGSGFDYQDGGVFRLDPSNTNSVTDIKLADETSNTTPHGLLKYIAIDPSTSKYYLSLNQFTNGSPQVDQSAIYSGSMSPSLGTLTKFADVINVNGLGPQGLTIEHIPTLSFTNSAPTFTEPSANPASTNQTPVTLITNASANDLDPVSSTDQLVGATVTITSGLFTGDQLTATTTGTNITATYTASTGVLALTGIDTFAHYQTVLNSVKFGSTSENPTNYGADTSRTVSWSVSDGLLSSVEQTSTVTVAAVDDAPVNNGVSAKSVNEDTQLAITGLSMTDVDADPANQNLIVTFSVTHGTLTIATNVAGGIVSGNITGGANGTNSITITAPQNKINATLASATGLQYQGVSNFNTTTGGSESLHIVTNDQGFNGTGGPLTDTDDLGITVNPVNDSPILANVGPSASSLEQTPAILDNNVTVSDVDLDPLNSGAGSYTGASLTIARNGGASAQDSFGFDTTGATFTVSGGNLQAGAQTFGTFTNTGGTLTITFTNSGTTPTTALVNNVIDHITYQNTNDNPPASITLNYTFNDGSPGNGQGTGAIATATGSILVTITGINDPPSGANKTVTTNEDTAYPFTTGDFGFTDVDGNVLKAVKIGTLPGAGSLTDNNTAVNSGDSIPVADITGNKLKFTPAANANGNNYANFTFQLQDDGGTANGGIDLESSSHTITINVTAINDPPSFTKGADQSTNKNSGPQTVAGWATNILAGPPDESTQTLTFNVTGNTNAALFSAGPAIDSATGTLTYTPANNAFGTATITITLSDNGSNVAPNSNTSAPQSFNITVINCSASATVTKTTDDGTAGTLRDAITNVCSGGTVDATGITGQINLSSALPDINKNLTLVGPGADKLEVRAQQTGLGFRVFNITSAATNVSISGLTMDNGSDTTTGGGGINNAGTLSLSDCAVGSGSTNPNATTTTNATTTNGGGIYNSGTLAINRCTISNNVATLNGGGIYNALTGILTIKNSTISTNTANVGGAGGGLYNAGTATLVNSTIAGNFAQTAGGGIFSTSTTNLGNTIIAYTYQAGGAVAVPDISGTFTSQGHNWIQNAGTAGNAVITDDPSTTGPNNTGDPKIQPILANNGGPTLTHAPLAGSPIVEAGANSLATGLATDQRGTGFPRIADSADADAIQTVDIGAFELHPSIEDIQDQTTAEDTPLDVTFNIGDATGANSPLISSVAASSSNTSLVTSDATHLAISGTGTTRTLHITPNTNANSPANGGTSTITVTVTATNGQTATDTFVLTVNAVDDAPTLTNNTGITVPEGSTGNTITSAKLRVDDVDNTSAQLIYIIGTPVAHGTLRKNGVALTSNSMFTQADINNNLLTYDHDGSETTADSFTFTVSDGAGGTIGSTVFQITVTPVNDPPTLATNAGLTVISGATATIDQTKLLVTDPDNTAAQLTFTVGTAPAHGTLKKNASALSGGNTFTQADINNNLITYTHNGDAATSDSFTFTVSDGAGGTIGSTPFNISINCGASDVVANTNDTGAGSLRNAITTACVGDTITFSNTTAGGATNFFDGTPRTITLTTGELAIAKSLKITGPGASLLTLSGGGVSRIFNLSSGTVALSNLTISGGGGVNFGGGLYNNGTLMLTNVVVTGNTAGVGGGLYNGGSMTLINSTVSNNSASNDQGGGIYDSGTALTLINSTVSGNTSTHSAVSTGGGIFNSGGTLSLINSTVSGNSANSNGGGIHTSDTLTAINSTITNNRSNADNVGAEQGGGIFQNAAPAITLKNTIVAGNFRGSGNTRDDVSGAVDATSSFNLIGDGTNLTGLTNGNNGNQVGNSTTPINALLGTLANNGGATQTHLLLPGSPAINAGSNALLPADTFDLNGNSNTGEALPVDQRGAGFNRIVNTTVDIGAVEVNYAISATNGSGQSAVINTPFSTQLQATVTESGNAVNGLAVTFTPPASGASGAFASSATVNTNPSGVATAPQLTANGTAGGPYNIVASLAGGTPSANFALTNLKATASVMLGNLTQLYDGTAKSATATTTPPGKAVVITYSQNNQSVAAPTNAGSYDVSATINDPNYQGSATGTLVITKATPTLTWNNPADITYGTALSATQLNATASVAGNFVYTPASGTVLNAGNSQTLALNFTPTDTINYNTPAQKTVSINVLKASSTTTVTVNDATYDTTPHGGTAVATGAGGLSQSLSVIYTGRNSTTYGPAPTAPTNAGDYTATATFNGDANHLGSSDSQNFTITKATATITLSSLAQTYDGSAKTATAVTTPANLTVSFSYTQNNQSVTSPTTVGSYNVTATITDSNYQGSTTGVLVINKATPVTTWNNPANIVYGTPLSNTQLNATANVAGTFTYNPPSGTVLTVGPHQLSVSFTPTDTTNYTTATATASVTVDPVTAAALNLDSASYTVNEGDGHLTITVNRTGLGTTAASVDYTTSDTAGLTPCNVFNGIASSRCDYATTVGTLHFAAGEMSKNIFIPIVDDSYAEGPETFTISLSNAAGENLGAVATATITIVDNDAVTGPNPLTDQLFFIRQQYVDFLGREPDAPGYQGWQDVLNNCPGSGIDSNGNHCDRIEVSSDFFRSEEFQTRGYFIYRFYKTLPSVSDPNNPQFGHIPHYAEFMPDFARVSGFLSAQQLEDQKAAFVTDFMGRTEFQTRYGALTDPTTYVTALLQTVGLPNHPTRQTWIDSLTSGSLTRAQVLRALIESTEMSTKYDNEAFVIMQYFGYLRRDADAQYAQWIQTLNQTGDYRMMINGFLNSPEYRQRFGP